MPITPKTPSLINIEKSAPLIKISPIKEQTITIPVPKSGSNMISPKNNIITKNNGTINLKVFLLSLSLLDKYLDVKIINDNLVISLGWKPNPNIPNQLLLPFLTLPIPGIKTNISKIKHTSKNLLECFLYKL